MHPRDGAFKAEGDAGHTQTSEGYNNNKRPLALENASHAPHEHISSHI